MTDAVEQLAWDAYEAALPQWIISGERGPEPHIPWQRGRRIETLPVEANPAGSNLPALVDEAAA